MGVPGRAAARALRERGRLRAAARFFLLPGAAPLLEEAVHRLRRAVAEIAGGLPAAYWWIWAGALVSNLCSFVFPFLALYLTAQGMTVEAAGTIVSLFGAGAVVAGPLGGILADRLGRRPTMLLSLTGGAVAAGLLGFLRAPGAIAAAVFTLGVVGPLFRPAMQASVADLVPPEGRPRAYGLVYWAVNLGYAIAYAAGGALAQVSYLGLFLADAATTGVFALIVWRKVPESRPADAAREVGNPLRGLAAPLGDGVFARFLLLNVCFGLVFMQLAVALPIDMRDHGISPAGFGALMALNGALIVLLQPFSGRLTARRDPSRVLALAALLVGVGYGAFAAGGRPWLYALGIAVFTIGEIGHMPVANALVADLSPLALRGRYQGAFSLTWGIALFAAPALGSLVMGRAGATALWAGCLGLGAIVAAGHLRAAAARRGRLRALHSPR